MKILIVVLLLFCSKSVALTQNFAPIGATWHYTQYIFSTSEQKFFKIESVQDSLFAGKNCRLLVKNEELYCEQRPLEVLVYEEDSVAYFWDEAFNEFQILYDLKKEVNEFWYVKVKANDQSTDTITVTVTGKQLRTINTIQLVDLDVTYVGNYHLLGDSVSWSSEILEKLGDAGFMFNFHPDQSMYCDDNFSGGFRCYEDNVLGFYSTNTAPSCEYTNVGVKDLSLSKLISVYPNPSNGAFKINNPNLLDLSCFLFNSTGQKMMECQSNKLELQFDEKIEAGIYFLKISHNQEQFIQKIVIK